MKKLVYVNLQECVTEFNPAELSRETLKQNRVLLLVDGRYVQRVYREGDNSFTETQPTDKAGQGVYSHPFQLLRCPEQRRQRRQVAT